MFDLMATRLVGSVCWTLISGIVKKLRRVEMLPTNIRHYQKRPVQVEAIQYDGQNFQAVSNFCDDTPALQVSRGDYVVKDVTGKFYACKPDIFAKTYELVTWEHSRSRD